MKPTEIQNVTETEITEHFIQAGICKVRYLTAGQGQPLVLIHTMRTQSDYFRKIIPQLSEYHLVYALDLPGHGGSSFPASVAYTEQFFRTTVRDFMQELKLKNVILVGESFGATIALTLAATDTNHTIEKVVAFNPYNYGKKGGIRRSSNTAKYVFTAIQLPFIGWIVSHSESDLILRKILEGGLNNNENLPDELLKRLSKARKKKGFAAAFRSMARNWKSWIASRKLYPQIHVPVTLVYSEYDWSTEAERMADQELIPGVKACLIKNTGHFSCMDNPVEVLKILLRD